MGVYTLKELEKFLPSIGSINQMQIKEYIQALQDENLIRVEKIGSGNWYWCFTSDGKKAKENTLSGLKTEEEKLVEAIIEAERAVEEETKLREDEDDGEMMEGGGVDRKALLEVYEGLLREQKALGGELALYSESDPAEVLRTVEKTKRLRESVIRWTDNIEALESLIMREIGDRAQVAGVMTQACGDEYVAGEGLKEL